MSVSARERVFKLRQAEYQVQKIKKEMQRAFPEGGVFDRKPLSRRSQNIRRNASSHLQQFRINQFHHSNPIMSGLGDPRRGIPIVIPPFIESPNEFETEDNTFLPFSINEKQLTRSQGISSVSSSERPSYCFVPKGPFCQFMDVHRSSPYAQPVLPLNLRNIQQRISSKTAKSQDLKRTQSKTEAALDALGQLQQSQLTRTKNSVELMKTKSKPNKLTKPPLKHQGQMFYHRFKFQETPQPSPIASQAPSRILKMNSSSNLPLLKSDQKLSTRQSRIGTNASLQGSNIGLGLKNKTSLESSENLHANLCLKSPLIKDAKGPTSWINRRFPTISENLITWQEHSHLMKSLKEGTYPSRNAQRPAYNRNKSPSPPEFAKEQPLPHRRGLIGIEISEFDAGCAVFYKGRQGTYNPHLHGSSVDYNSNIDAGNDDGSTVKMAIPIRKKKDDMLTKPLETQDNSELEKYPETQLESKSEDLIEF